MKSEPRAVTADQTAARFDFLKKVAIEISDEIYKNLNDVDPKNTYDIIGIMAEERNVAKYEIKNVVAMVMAKLYINLLGKCRKNGNNVSEKSG